MGAFLKRGHEEFPDASIAQTHGMTGAIPAVEIAEHADHLCIRCPDGESHAGHVFARYRVRAQGPIAFVISALAVKVQLKRSEQGRKAVRVFEFERLAGVELDADAIVRGRVVEDGEIEAGGMDAFHPDGFFPNYEISFGGLRKPRADIQVVGPEDGKRVVVAAFDYGIKLGGKHLCIVCHYGVAGRDKRG